MEKGKLGWDSMEGLERKRNKMDSRLKGMYENPWKLAIATFWHERRIGSTSIASYN